MITRAVISHYKSLADIDVEFGTANVIVGLNGSGKSNFIDCFNFLRDAADDDLDSATTKRHGVESIRQWSKSRPYNIIFHLYFSETDSGGTTHYGDYRLVLASSKGVFRVVEETGNWKGSIFRTGAETINQASFSRDDDGTVRFQNDSDSPQFSESIRLPVTELFITHAGRFGIQSLLFRHLIREISSLATYAIYPNTIRQPQVLSRAEFLAEDGSNLAAIVKRLNSGLKERKDRLLDSLKAVLPIISDIQIKSAGGYYVPIVRVLEPNGDQHDLNMSQISDGTLRMLGLLTAFYQPDAPQRIALEEPEQMIHPGLLPILRDAANDYLDIVRGSQFFVTTHSPAFIDLFPPSSLIWVSFSNGASIAGRVPKRQLDLIKERLFTAGELLVSEGIGS